MFSQICRSGSRILICSSMIFLARPAGWSPPSPYSRRHPDGDPEVRPDLVDRGDRHELQGVVITGKAIRHESDAPSLDLELPPDRALGGQRRHPAPVGETVQDPRIVLAGAEIHASELGRFGRSVHVLPVRASRRGSPPASTAAFAALAMPGSR